MAKLTDRERRLRFTVTGYICDPPDQEVERVYYHGTNRALADISYHEALIDLDLGYVHRLERTAEAYTFTVLVARV